MRVVVVLSGGMDSTTLLYDMMKAKEVKAISFNYGQKHVKEIEMAKKTCEKLGVGHKVIDISSINELLQGSSLTTKDMKVPEGHYEEDSMKQTMVPNRNMIMLSLAIGYAASLDYNTVAYAAHSGDHAIYPDCRKEFVDRIDFVSQIANYRPIRVVAPYLTLNKGTIACLGKVLKVDYSLTWTCYKGKEKACGKCGACTERVEAFQKAEMEDPIDYE